MAEPVQDNEPVNAEPFSQKILNITKGLIFQMAIMYFISNFLFKRQTGGQLKPSNQSNLVPCYFLKGQPLSIFVYMSDLPEPNSNESARLLFNDDNFIFLEWNSGKTKTKENNYFHTFTPSPSLLNNGSLYLVVCVSRNKEPPKFSLDEGYKGIDHNCVIRELSKKRKLISSNKKNLLFDGQPKILHEDTWLSHWHPNMTINIIFDDRLQNVVALPEFARSEIHLTPDGLAYYPIIHLSDYWNLKSDYLPLTPENKTLNLSLNIAPLSFFKWQMYLGLSAKSQFALTSDTEIDEDSFKRVLIETPLYLLALSVFITLAHSFFEFLAFKNDIQFWNNRKDLTGLSVSGVLFGLFQTVVFFLYILDNDANFMLIIGAGIGCLIEAWKITKVVDISFDYSRPIGPFPRIVFKDKSTYVDSNTRQYDRMALKYLSVCLFPLFICYSIYSVVYYEHKGWYSFVLSLVYGFLLTFGFIMMTPQLFINYKLKSVAHLPWRMLTYKALNTFIDDVFAFIIKTPTLYRISCLRDDVVFFVYLYQRWIYPIDKTRINEFGGTGEDSVIQREKLD